MPENPTVLMIEDELPIRRFLKPSLQSHDFKVLEAVTGTEGLALATSHNPDIILLDLGLPDMDGLEVLKRLREWTPTPIIVITARDKEKDKIAGLDAGADDYLTKPFDVGELLARIRVALRHAQRVKQGGKQDPVFETPDFKVDLSARVVTVRGKEVHLTPNEYDLLAFLIRHAGKVVTQKQILQEVWGPASGDQVQYLRIYVYQLRQKIEADPDRPRYILTESGVGYRLKAD
ncbi:MAG TPA: response regulator [bacterium]|nr:response regulator [bacterium]